MMRWLSTHRVLTLQSIVLLSVARAALFVFPFKITLHVVNWSSTRRLASGSDRAEAIKQVSRAVDRATQFVPEGGHCLPRALVAKVLLARRGVLSELRLGVAKDTSSAIIAHAWLEVAGVPIFGLTAAELPKYSLLTAARPRVDP